jgi:hypothetical protein
MLAGFYGARHAPPPPLAATPPTLFAAAVADAVLLDIFHAFITPHAATPFRLMMPLADIEFRLSMPLADAISYFQAIFAATLRHATPPLILIFSPFRYFRR